VGGREEPKYLNNILIVVTIFAPSDPPATAVFVKNAFPLRFGDNHSVNICRVIL